MRYNSSLYIDDLKDFLADVNLTLEEKKITDKELKNLNSLGESYFNSRVDNSIYSYYVYDKNNLEKTHKANDEIKIAKKRFGKFFIKLQKKLCIIWFSVKYTINLWETVVDRRYEPHPKSWIKDFGCGSLLFLV